jgi:hypothetical protein
MPTPVDSLTKDSSEDTIKSAISKCISIKVDNGEEQDRAVAICLDMARRNTGKSLGK